MNDTIQAPSRTDAGGRPLGSRTIRACAGRHAKDAIGALAKVASDNSAPSADRVRAAEVLLSHAVTQQGGVAHCS